MKEVIIVEQGRINWRGEYCTVAYVPVDSEETAKATLEMSLEEYRKNPRATITKHSENAYYIEIEDIIGEHPANYIMQIKHHSIATMETLKKGLECINEKISTIKNEIVLCQD